MCYLDRGQPSLCITKAVNVASTTFAWIVYRLSQTPRLFTGIHCKPLDRIEAIVSGNLVNIVTGFYLLGNHATCCVFYSLGIEETGLGIHPMGFRDYVLTPHICERPVHIPTTREDSFMPFNRAGRYLDSPDSVLNKFYFFPCST